MLALAMLALGPGPVAHAAEGLDIESLAAIAAEAPRVLTPEALDRPLPASAADLRALIADDFRAGRTVRCAGWILSETEVSIIAAALA